MPHLALYTFGVLKSPLTDPARLTQEFYESGEAVYREIGSSIPDISLTLNRQTTAEAHFSTRTGVHGESLLFRPGTGKAALWKPPPWPRPSHSGPTCAPPSTPSTPVSTVRR
ncbi:hypothetical protein GCM10020000_77780 [Streptomyces olivoverticillatus]